MEKAETKNLLKSLQGSYFGALEEAIKTVPTEVGSSPLCTTSLDLVIKILAELIAYRQFKCQDERNNRFGFHTRLGSSMNSPCY